MLGDVGLILGKTGSYSIGRRKATSHGAFSPTCPE